MGYILEKLQKGEDKWERCNDFLVPVLSYTVRDLTEGKSYQFRVKAENAAGVSEPSRSSLFVKAADAVGQYPSIKYTLSFLLRNNIGSIVYIILSTRPVVSIFTDWG